jgi:hypothetical protein
MPITSPDPTATAIRYIRTLAPPAATQAEAEYLATPARSLFQRSGDAIGFFNLIAQTSTGFQWDRMPKMIKSALTANVPAYANAVGSSSEEEEILWSWAANYAQDSSRAGDWEVTNGYCKPEESVPVARHALSLANGSEATLSVDPWTAALAVPYSTADVVQIDPTKGHFRLSSGALDRERSGQTAFCTRSPGNCTCPGSSQMFQRINGTGETLIAITGGPTGAEATVSGKSLEDYCNKTSAGSCSLLSAKQMGSVLGLTNAIVLDTPVYSSPVDADVNYGCELGAWTGSKPTSGPQTLQRAMSGKAAQVAYEIWSQGTGRNAGKWPAEFQKLTQGFKQGVIPNLYAPGPPGQLTPASYGYGTAGVTTKLGPPLVGLVFAGACWWNAQTLTAICLGDWEASGKPVVDHLKKLAAIVIPHTLDLKEPQCLSSESLRPSSSSPSRRLPRQSPHRGSPATCAR